MPAKSALRVGVYQPDAEVGTPAARLDALAATLAGIEKGACDLVVCPELFLSGYFAGDEFEHLAEGVDGPFAARMGELATVHQCAMAYGFPERAEAGVYNSALCIGPDGEVLAHHRKALLPHSYEEAHFRCGDAPTAFLLQGWRIGLVICYEIELPEPARHHARGDCDLVIAPTALLAEWSAVAGRVVPTRAFENTIFVAYANFTGCEAGNDFLGASVVASPWGDDLVRADSTAGLYVATLHPAELTRARARLHGLRDAAQPPYA